MKYGKIIGGKLITAHKAVFLKRKIVVDPTTEELLAAGYLPIQETEEPTAKKGFVKSSKWVQTDTAIVKKWTVLPDRRPLTQDAVSKLIIAQQINTLAVDDNTALRMKQFYPTFESIMGQTVKKGFKFTHGDYLWATVKELTIQSHYAPGDGMESLYTKVNETHAGTLEDPIPYDGNMALENGKHYSQHSTIYLCNRDTVNPVYDKLADLVGLYVVEV